MPHYWEHVRWVWGAADMDEFLALCPSITLDGVLDRVTVPFLVTHGQNDRQIPARIRAPDLRPARQQPQARAEDLHDREGGVEHVGVDNMTYGRDYIADWFAETFGEITGPGLMAALTLAQADRIADAALAAGDEHGFAPLCVVVLDTGGHALVVKRDERSSIGRVEVATGKAHGCLALGFGGRELARRADAVPKFFIALAMWFRRGSCRCPAVCSSATDEGLLLGGGRHQR